MIGESTSAGSMRINPVGLNRVARSVPSAMGIVRRRGRDAVRRSSEGHERAGQPGSSEAHGVGHQHKVVRTSLVEIVAKERARHSTADRPRVRHDPSSEGETPVAS